MHTLQEVQAQFHWPCWKDLIRNAGAVRECTFSETNNKREVFDEIDELVNALPKTYKRRAVDVANTHNASCSGL